jgi:4-hydroxy-tetrahydrodipicolinate reductase
MKIALIGRGAMGQLVGEVAQRRGHDVACVIGSDAGAADAWAPRLLGCDVAIDFSVASAVPEAVEACLSSRVPLVEGTTGWDDVHSEIEKKVTDFGGTMVFAANFSIGVNLFYRVTEFSAQLFSRVGGYEPFIEEQHHSRKKDAPSGTALKLKEIVSGPFAKGFSVTSTRAGNIPGTHRVGFDGSADQVLLEHTARGREGFAAGAVMAAEWIVGRKGFFEFSDVIDDVLRQKDQA